MGFETNLCFASRRKFRRNCIPKPICALQAAAGSQDQSTFHVDGSCFDGCLDQFVLCKSLSGDSDLMDL